ncbi:MAG: sulfotransferase domain-containing protein [Actinobacteria bacterium]|nr:sulfotransferase domain-containing protein [Actinomycetota bacterium]
MEKTGLSQDPERIYRHAMFDSRRWQEVKHRPGDIVISTSMKAGTTWMQGIVRNLLWPSDDIPGGRVESPWVEARWSPIEEINKTLASQEHRRFIKTHLPADGLPFYEEVLYVVVARDGRDVFMSTVNHWDKMRDDFIDWVNELAAGEGAAPLPKYDGDLHRFFDSWISQGSFPWQGDGAPWWSHFHHIATWWELRGRENVLLVHYNDLLADLETEMRRVAAFCNINVPERMWSAITERCTLAEMRSRADALKDYDDRFEGGASSFFYRGTNGRWQGVLTERELARYDKRVSEALEPEAARWLEGGRHESSLPH